MNSIRIESQYKKMINLIIVYRHMLGIFVLGLLSISGCTKRSEVEIITAEPLPAIAQWPVVAQKIIETEKLDKDSNGFIDAEREIMLVARYLAKAEIGDHEKYTKRPVKTTDTAGVYLRSITNPVFDLQPDASFITPEFEFLPCADNFSGSVSDNKVTIKYIKVAEEENFPSFNIGNILIPPEATRLRIIIENSTMPVSTRFLAFYLNFDKKRPEPPYDWPDAYSYNNYLLNGDIKTGTTMTYWIPEESLINKAVKLSGAFGDISALKAGEEITFSITFSK
jgi:hypothetical protein